MSGDIEMFSNSRTKCLYLLCGPSGSGKSTVGQVLTLLDLRESLSYTTRKCRDAADKNAYHFISREQFEDMCATGKFIEYTEYAGNMYGTTFFELDQSDYAILEPEGVEAVLSRYTTRPVKVLGLWASRTKLERRLRQRPDKSLERIENDLLIFKDLHSTADLFLNGLSKKKTILSVLDFMEECERNSGARF